LERVLWPLLQEEYRWSHRLPVALTCFNIAGRYISGWIKSFKTGTASSVRQPSSSQLEERLLLWLEYHPQVARYVRGDIGPQSISSCGA